MNNSILKYLSISFLIALSIISTHILCIIESIDVYSNGQKSVCLIGEVHNLIFSIDDPKAQDELRDRDYTFDLVRSAAQNSEPAIFILEASDDEASLYISELAQNPTLQSSALISIELYAQANNKKIGNVQFVFADNRQDEVYIPYFYAGYIFTHFSGMILEDLKAALNKLQIKLPDKISVADLDQELIKNSALRQMLFGPDSKVSKFFRTQKNVHDCTPGELMNVLENRLRQLKKSEKTLDKRSPVFQFLKSNEKQLTKIIADATHFFETITGCKTKKIKKSVADCIHDAFVNKLFTFTFRECQQWMKPLYCITADIDFAIALADALAQANKVIFFGGDLHRKMLQKIFSSDSSFKKLVSAENGYRESEDPIHSSLWSDETINAHFINTKKALGFLLPFDKVIMSMNTTAATQCSQSSQIPHEKKQCCLYDVYQAMNRLSLENES